MVDDKVKFVKDYSNNLRFETDHINPMSFGAYGMGASIAPGNQLMNTNTAINWGLKHLELQVSESPDREKGGYSGQLGKSEREQLAQLSKLNAVDLSIHAPHFDASGFIRDSFSEPARKAVVEEVKKSIDFADDIGKISGQKRIPIIFHASEGVPGNPNPNEFVYVVNRESGKVDRLVEEEVAFDKKYLEEHYKFVEGKDFFKTDKEGVFKLTPQAAVKMENQNVFDNIKQSEASAWHNLRIHESNLINSIQSLVRDVGEGVRANEILQQFQNNPQRVEEELRRIGGPRAEAIIQDLKAYELLKENNERQRQMIENFKKKYIENGSFKLLDDVEKFALKKAAKTIAELGEYAWSKPTKPVICVENYAPELAFSKPETFKELIKETRKELSENLIKKGLSPEEAKKEAEEIIGANIDIGHFNLWKKFPMYDEKGNLIKDEKGRPKYYSKKEIQKMAEALLPYAKHIHITDNLGDVDAHLPVGWGDAPVAELVEAANKQAGEGGFKGKMVFETFGVMYYGGQTFGIQESLYNLKSPVYGTNMDLWSMSSENFLKSSYGFTMGAIPGGEYWPDVGEYNVGFSGLPYTAGAKPQSKGSGFSGAPMS